jgi:hypothetical protein
MRSISSEYTQSIRLAGGRFRLSPQLTAYLRRGRRAIAGLYVCLQRLLFCAFLFVQEDKGTEDAGRDDVGPAIAVQVFDDDV